MDYKGKLYGGAYGKYFDTGKTAEDWDKLESDKAELLEALKDFVLAVENEEIIIQNNTDNDGFENTGGLLYENAKKIIEKATKIETK